MLKAIVTGKGQITLPSDVRKALNIRTGDKIVFEVKGNELAARVLHVRDIDELFAALPGTSYFAGAEIERDAYHEALAERHTKEPADES